MHMCREVTDTQINGVALRLRHRVCKNHRTRGRARCLTRNGMREDRPDFGTTRCLRLMREVHFHMNPNNAQLITPGKKQVQHILGEVNAGYDLGGVSVPF